MMDAKKAVPRLKNWTSMISVDESLTIIRRSLSSHKAKRIIFEGDDGEGNPTGLSFSMALHGQHFLFRMPVHFDKVAALVEAAYKETGSGISSERLLAQAQRTAWANIKDWTLAQMALIDSGGAQLEEVFFPYLVDERGRTAFEVFEERLALPAPKNGSAKNYSISEVE